MKTSTAKKTTALVKKKIIPDSFVQEFLRFDNSKSSKNKKNKVKTLEKVKNLANNLKKEIIGQNAAIDNLVEKIKQSYLKLSQNPNKPQVSMLFLGPTGVGKSQTAKSLANHLLSKEKIIRIDMSDYAEKHTVARLVGSPPGYVGYGEGGVLTNFIEVNYKCVVLFDEIEKAHRDVLNIMLQILEEGEIQNGEGEIINFKKCYVILTSNLGVELINKDSIGFLNHDYDIKNKHTEEKLKDNLKKKVKPEILNRLDSVVVFNLLKKQDVRKILDKELDFLKGILVKKHNVDLRVPLDVKDFLLKKGYNKEYGAREIKRCIEHNLTDKVADFILTSKKLDKKAKKPLKVVAKIDGGLVKVA